MSNRDNLTVEGFGEEWSRFTQAELSTNELETLFNTYFSIFPWATLPENASGFDMGCGSGRWAKLVAPRVGKLTCVDASEKALAVAQVNLTSNKNCSFAHASVDHLPWPDGTMDFGYSLGVLHHVPDTLGGLKSCTKKLKPGAPFLLYLYYRFDNRPLWFKAIWHASHFIRLAVSRCPSRLRHLICEIIAIFVYFPLARISRWAENKLNADVKNWPLSSYRNLSFYTMRTDALDRFGTQLEQRFTKLEIKRMMEQADLAEIKFSETTPYWVAVGRKVH
ncbi:MAG: class I SAM-dependent methyltransferase [Bdellovibrionales bacterium]|nr:class I SAM-dependent methyltransferase [Bdellovibrionales bacterium]